ncbi:MAG: hypothetical protein AB7N80_00830 [Bdellovibrionales bacterium]
MRLHLLASFVLIVWCISARADWTDFVTNPDLKFKGGQLTSAPPGYNFDMEKGEISGGKYRLEVEKAKEQVAVNETFRSTTPLSADEIKEGIKSKDSFQFNRTLLRVDGQMLASTKCIGERQLSTFKSMVLDIFNKKTSGNILGNSRTATCHTVTPQMCRILREEMKKYGNHDIKKYSEACQKYAADMSDMYKKIFDSVPAGLLDSERASAEKAYKRAAKADSGSLDYSAVNLSVRYGEMPAEQRLNDLRVGMVMFTELVELEKACPKSEITSRVRANAVGREAPAR